MEVTAKVGARVPTEEYRELKALLARRGESLQHWVIRKIREEISHETTENEVSYLGSEHERNRKLG